MSSPTKKPETVKRWTLTWLWLQMLARLGVRRIEGKSKRFPNTRWVSHLVFDKFIRPTSNNEDAARREFILNLFLLAIVALLLAAFIVVVHNSLVLGAQHDGASPYYIGGVLLTFVTLLSLSRAGHAQVISSVFLCIFFAILVYGIYLFGVDLPQTLLGFALLIVMAGVLSGSRGAFFMTFLSILVIITVGYSQINGWYVVKSYWKQEVAANGEDPIMFSITLGIIALAAWLSNREIEKSLIRVRTSEAELKKERDALEITVEQRTRALREAQAEKMAQLYRLAEFGRLSSGLFHDLINPLNAVTLNMERLRSTHPSGAMASPLESQTKGMALAEAEMCVDRAVHAAKKLEDLVVSIRKQLAGQESKTTFFLKQEIQSVIDVLSYRAQQANVTISLEGKDTVPLFGDAVKFNQVILNLVTNAIDAYPPSEDFSEPRTIKILFEEESDVITLRVQDQGIGIPEANKERIFEAFFTTKTDGGIGIGLTMAKRIIEKDFRGQISVMSREGQGTTFTLIFPMIYEQ